MATDATRIVVPQMQRLYLAPTGTTAPDGPSVSMPTGWKEVGLFTEDSLKFNTDVNFEDVRAAQSRYAVRKFQTTEDGTFEVDLEEWSASNFQGVYGGGTVTVVTPVGGGSDYYKFVPPAVGGRANVAACIEVVDGTLHWRRIIPKCLQTQGVELGLSATAAATLPLRMSVIGSDSADPWYDLTDMPSFNPV